MSGQQRKGAGPVVEDAELARLQGLIDARTQEVALENALTEAKEAHRAAPDDEGAKETKRAAAQALNEYRLAKRAEKGQDATANPDTATAAASAHEGAAGAGQEG